MTNHFHKSCYTTRSSGYKYRTLSTNTGDRKRRDSREDNCYDRVFRDMRREICNRLDTEFDKTGHSRDAIFSKLAKIDSKISSMIELQENVLAMRQTLNTAELSLADMLQKVQKIEAFNVQSVPSVPHSLKSKKSSNRPKEMPVLEMDEEELYSSDMDPVKVIQLPVDTNVPSVLPNI